MSALINVALDNRLAVAAGKGSTAGHVLKRIPVVDIEVADGGRELQSDRVEDLAASMVQIGMLSPIGVRIVA
jgi:hypothetical protein